MASVSEPFPRDGEFDADLDDLLNIVDDETEREIENYDNRHRRYGLTTHALVSRSEQINDDSGNNALFDRDLLLNARNSHPSADFSAQLTADDAQERVRESGTGVTANGLTDILNNNDNASVASVTHKRCMSSTAQRIEDNFQDFDFNELFGRSTVAVEPLRGNNGMQKSDLRRQVSAANADFVTLLENGRDQDSATYAVEIAPARRPVRDTNNAVAADVILLPPRKVAKLVPANARHLQNIDRSQVLTLVEQVKQTVVQRASTSKSSAMLDTNIVQCQLLRAVNKTSLQIWLTEPLDFDTVPVSGIVDLRRVYARHRRDEYQAYLEKLADATVFEQRAFAKMRELVDRARAATIERRSAPAVEAAGSDFAVEQNGSSSLRRLWVDRFRPLAYIELLSEEQVNLTLLTWFKSWDVLVFKKEKNAGEVRKLTASLKRHKAEMQQKKYKFSKQSGQWRKVAEIKAGDPRNGPDQKLVLLAGPPGLGKTTMAHVIARQAGFDVLEVNASDDRGLELIRARVDDTLNNSSIRTTKPKCLIMDEVDGLPAHTANYLVSLLKNSSKATSTSATNATHLADDAGDDDADRVEDDLHANSSPVKKRQRRKKMQKLMRPIIAICNDLYTPALRELRRHALVIHCPHISRQKLIHRLNYICHTTRTQADMTTLNLLCEKAADDIRTCINTLQFLSDRSPHICTADIAAMQLQNANKKSIFQLLESTFKFPVATEALRAKLPPRKAPGATGATDGTNISGNDADERAELILHHSNTMRVHRLVQSSGEHERIMHAVHENYLQVRATDTRIDAVQEVSEWFCYADIFERAGGVDDQKWALKGYARFLAPATYLHTASARRTPEFTYPMMAFNLQRERQEHCAAAQTLMQAAPTDVYAYCNNVATFSAEIAPHLANFMLPSLSNVVSTSRLNSADAVRVNRAVDLMLSYGISLREEYAAPPPEGGAAVKTSYVPEPNVEKMAKLITPVIGFNGHTVRTNANAIKSVDAGQQSWRLVLAAELERRRSMHLRTAAAADQDEHSSSHPQPVNIVSMFDKAEQAEMIEREMLVRDADQPWRSVSFSQNNLDELQTASNHKSLLRRLNSVSINIEGGVRRPADTRTTSVVNIKSSSKRFGYYRYCEGNIQPAVRCAFIEDILN